jgi:hypothetical protein
MRMFKPTPTAAAPGAMAQQAASLSATVAGAPDHVTNPCPHDLGRISILPPTENGLRTRTATGGPEDRFEQEADRIADRVMGMSLPSGDEAPAGDDPTSGASLRTLPDHPSPRPKSDWVAASAHGHPGGHTSLNASISDRLSALRGGARPLPDRARRFFEPCFGYDFSKIRIHTGSEAGRLAGSIGARAFALGSDIVFGDGQFCPQTWEGLRLIAHELTHVVQQRGSTAGSDGVQCKPDPDFSLSPAGYLDRVQQNRYYYNIRDKDGEGWPKDGWPFHATLVPLWKPFLKPPGGNNPLIDGAEPVEEMKPFIDQVIALQKDLGQVPNHVRGAVRYETDVPKAQSSPPETAQPQEGKDNAAQLEQLADAIAAADDERVIEILWPGALSAQEVENDVTGGAFYYGARMSQALWLVEDLDLGTLSALAHDFPLGQGNTSGQRWVAVVASANLLAQGFSDGDYEDAFDAILEAADGLKARSAVLMFLQSAGENSAAGVLAEEESAEQVDETLDLLEDVHQVQSTPLKTFQNRLKKRVLKRLSDNAEDLGRLKKSLSSQNADNPAWQRIKEVIVPNATIFYQLAEIEQELPDIIGNTKKAVAAALEGDCHEAAMHYAWDRGTPPEDAWWRANSLLGGGGCTDYPPIEALEQEVADLEASLPAVRAERARIVQRFPLVKAVRGSLLAALRAGPQRGEDGRSDPKAEAAFRVAMLGRFQHEIIGATEQAIAELIDMVERDQARLDLYGPLVRQVKDELLLDPAGLQAVNAWLESMQSRDQIIQVATTGLSIALGIASLLMTGGASAVVLGIAGSAVGLGGAAYNSDIAAEQFTASRAGQTGEDLVDQDLATAESAFTWALVDLVLSGLDLALAVKAASATSKGGKAVLESGSESGSALAKSRAAADDLAAGSGKAGQVVAGAGDEFSSWLGRLEKGLAQEIEADPELLRALRDSPRARRMLTACHSPCELLLPRKLRSAKWVRELDAFLRSRNIPEDHVGLKEYLTKHKSEPGNAFAKLNDAVATQADLDGFLETALVTWAKKRKGVEAKRVGGRWMAKGSEAGEWATEWELGTHKTLQSKGATDSFFQSHHGVQGEWARQRINELSEALGLGKLYRYDDANTILLRDSYSGTPHRRITDAQSARKPPSGQPFTTTFEQELARFRDDMKLADVPDAVVTQFEARSLAEFGDYYRQLKSAGATEAQLAEVFGNWAP